MKKKFNKSINYFISFTIFFQSSTSAWSTLFRPEETPQSIASTTRESLEKVNEKVEKLKKDIDDIYENMNISSTINERIIVIGPTGSGKTTFLNGLKGEKLIIKDGNKGLYLDIDNSSLDNQIAHNNNTGTTIPTCEFEDSSEKNKIAWWDCPGFMDPRGAEADIVNAFAIDRLFQNAIIKVILVVEQSVLEAERGGNFFKLLNRVSNLFSDQDQLKDCLTLIITKKDRGNPCGTLSDYVKNEEKNRSESLDDKSYAILNFLSTNNDRIACFFYPRKDSGAYQFNKEAIINSVRQSRFIENPSIKISVDTNSGELVKNFADEINNNIMSYLIKNAHKGIEAFCKNIIINHKSSLNELQQNLKNKLALGDFEKTKTELSSEDLIAYLKTFINSLQKFFDVKSIQKNIDYLNFLKKIDSTIEYKINDWVSKIRKEIKDIKKKYTEDSQTKSKIKNNILHISNTSLLGTSTINKIIKKINKPFSEIKAISDYYFFIDEDIKLPGVNLYFEGKIWKVINNPTIDISGKPGDTPLRNNSNLDGENGLPGGKGGDFKGKAEECINMEHLTINVRGGQGGNGNNGSDATKIYVDNREWTGVNKALISRKKYNNETIKDYFLNWGVKFLLTANSQFIEIYRTWGGKGGQGGEGGLSGKLALNFTNHPDISPRLKSKPGLQGKPGRDGRAYQGIYFAEYVLAGIRKINEEDRKSSIASEVKTPATATGISIGKAILTESAEKNVLKFTIKKAPTLAAAAKMSAYGSAKSGVKKAFIVYTKESAKLAAEQSVGELSHMFLISAGYSVFVTAIASSVSSNLSSGWIKRGYLPSERIHFEELIKERYPHLSENFIMTLLDNAEAERRNDHYIDGNEPQNFSLTGSPLTPSELKKIIDYGRLCKHVYTDERTRKFVKDNNREEIIEKWKKLINQKNTIDNFCNLLEKIREKEGETITLKDVHLDTGKYGCKEFESIGRKTAKKNIEEDTQSLLKRINEIINILGMKPIDTESTIDVIILKFSDIQRKMDNRFFKYFKNVCDNPDLQIRENDINSTKYQLNDEAVIEAYFLHKSEFLDLENLTFLHVGFRNCKEIKSILNSIRSSLVSYSSNPNAGFEKGELDYVSYIITKNEKKDKLNIIYSGSNSLKDWVADITLGRIENIDLSVHEGIGQLFNNSTEELNTLVKNLKKYYDDLERTPQNLEINIAGHSLGGALATLCAYYFKKIYIPSLCKHWNISKNQISIKTYTYGAPAIFGEPSKRKIESVLDRNNIYRIWTYTDPVVYVSSQIGTYHVGRSCLLHNIENNEFNITSNLFWGPHSIERYLNYLFALEKCKEDKTLGKREKDSSKDQKPKSKQQKISEDDSLKQAQASDFLLENDSSEESEEPEELEELEEVWVLKDVKGDVSTAMINIPFG